MLDHVAILLNLGENLHTAFHRQGLSLDAPGEGVGRIHRPPAGMRTQEDGPGHPADPAQIPPLPLGTGIPGARSPTLQGSGGFGELLCAAGPARPDPSPPNTALQNSARETKLQSRKFENNLPTRDPSKGSKVVRR